MAKTTIKNKGQTAYNQLMFNFNIKEIEANDAEYVNACLHNISKMLPKLFKDQQEDVLFAEKRFNVGKGVMLTNGTGTGKTFVGLGVVKRFHFQGKTEILIIVPTDRKCTDWIEEGSYIGLQITQLKDVRDAGGGICVTTYANFYQNDAICTIHRDLVVYDESHYLCQNQAGKETVYLEKHKKIANVPSSAREKVNEIIAHTRPEYDGTSNYFQRMKEYEMKHQELTEQYVNSTKILFLSATPFAYHKNIKYADGCLFDIEELLRLKDKDFVGYNQPIGYNQFLVENFGYRMMYNKCTIPESGVDVNLMERNFFEKMKQQGIMSTRVLELEKDYSRHFVTVDSEIGDFINKGMELFYEEEFRKAYPTLTHISSKKYNYLYVNQLLECIKAQESIIRIQQHLDLNRKVVIFHNYNNAAIEHPFQFDVGKLLVGENRSLIPRLRNEIKRFDKEYPEFVNLDLSNLHDVRTTITNAFPTARQYNGVVTKKSRSEAINLFNDNDSNTNILLVQIKAGKEGISLHDKLGTKQRVLINMGLPTAPVEAVQSEGRIYRQGLKSNAIYEYVTLQTTFERIAFGQKIAERSRTVENLAMGNLARNLEISFKEGYINSSYEPPSKKQGTGGKEADKFEFNISEFDKAVTYYYSRGKRTFKNKSREGTDYFATPEFLGFKMVEWINPQPDERGLEPSAGHGAIARWFPEHCNNTFIEPSIHLIGELGINSKGDIRNGTFESHNPVNKYDFIVMNPPFGKQGKTAYNHVEKALLKHTKRNDIRVMAIIPIGSLIDKKISALLASDQRVWLHTEILLPSCVFERAGTNVMTRIVYLIRAYYYGELPRTIDLTYIQTIKEFIEVIKDMQLE